MKRWLPLLICLAHFFILIHLARQHPFGNYATETDFYHLYAPDAERIAAGQFPQNTFQGPGYPALIALIGKLTSLSGDLFTVGKWLSVICAMLCGWLIFVLFARLFGFWVGLSAQLVAIASGQFPQFSINAATDVFFLALCLAVLVVLTGSMLSLRWRVMLSAALTGAAYLTRYNGLFLVAACIVGLVLLNLFETDWRERFKWAAVFVAVFFVTASPWLIASYKYRGSPFYNTNYLNIATEFYPELVAGKTNQDGTRALEATFKSFGDVLRFAPLRLIKQYPINLYQSLRDSIRTDLVNQWVGWLGWLGILLALLARPSKAVLLVLLAGALYLLLMALNHWETRYYFFIMVLYAGFAMYAVSRCFALVRAQGWLRQPAFTVIPVVIVGAMFAMSLAESRRDVLTFLASKPTEVIGARDYIQSTGAAPHSLRIVARKPHLAYLSRQEWLFFPQVKSLDEFRIWVESNRVDYIAIGKRELKERKELKALSDPKKAPDWLKAVWVNDDPDLILYQPVNQNR